jgi:cathepsin B
MKYFSLICLISLIFCAKNLQRAKEISAYVNSLNTTWKATEKSFDTDGYLGTFLRGQENVIPKKTKFSVSLSDLPSSFDLRDAYPNCESLKEIRDQSKCGSCWAFGAAETMSDRICIKSGQKLQTRVSPQHLVTCCSICGFGCSGGWPSMAFYSWWWSGVPTGGLY